jgi:hypothetical protein
MVADMATPARNAAFSSSWPAEGQLLVRGSAVVLKKWGVLGGVRERAGLLC